MRKCILIIATILFLTVIAGCNQSQESVAIATPVQGNSGKYINDVLITNNPGIVPTSVATESPEPTETLPAEITNEPPIASEDSEITPIPENKDSVESEAPALTGEPLPAESNPLPNIPPSTPEPVQTEEPLPSVSPTATEAPGATQNLIADIEIEAINQSIALFFQYASPFYSGMDMNITLTAIEIDESKIDCTFKANTNNAFDLNAARNIKVVLYSVDRAKSKELAKEAAIIMDNGTSIAISISKTDIDFDIAGYEVTVDGWNSGIRDYVKDEPQPTKKPKPTGGKPKPTNEPQPTAQPTAAPTTAPEPTQQPEPTPAPTEALHAQLVSASNAPGDVKSFIGSAPSDTVKRVFNADGATYVAVVRGGPTPDDNYGIAYNYARRLSDDRVEIKFTLTAPKKNENGEPILAGTNNNPYPYFILKLSTSIDASNITYKVVTQH